VVGFRSGSEIKALLGSGDAYGLGGPQCGEDGWALGEVVPGYRKLVEGVDHMMRNSWTSSPLAFEVARFIFYRTRCPLLEYEYEKQ
jgi:hypothetical protein